MNEVTSRLNLAQEPDFEVGGLRVSPSSCRVLAGSAEVRVEAQTMAVLVVLARAGGATVSRDELINACWLGRIVSDDAVGRTIAKVRVLAKAADPAPFVLETVPKVGYRLLAQARAEAVAPSLQPPGSITTGPAGWKQRPAWALVAAAVGLAALSGAWMALQPTAGPSEARHTSQAGAPPTAVQMIEALLNADAGRVQEYLRLGWDVNWQLDSEGNRALHDLPGACERNHGGHDPSAVVHIAQILVAAGEDTTLRNRWDDSPLDIAIAPRYCGPHHPLTEYLKSIVPAEEIRRVMARACSEAFGGAKSKSDWAKSDITRAECAAAAH
ncbi:MAG: winged helix-turn-helix domain-containing protein [Hyphomonadaceae bacterium]